VSHDDDPDLYEFGQRAVRRDLEGLRDPALDTPLVGPERLQGLLAGAQRQLPDRELALLAGTTPRTWADWKRRAGVQEGQTAMLGVEPGRYAMLFRAIDEARAEGGLEKGIVPDAKMALSILERRRPAEWGPVNRFRLDPDEAEEAREVLAIAAAGRSVAEAQSSTPKALADEASEGRRERAALPAAVEPAEPETGEIDGLSPDLAALLAEAEGE